MRVFRGRAFLVSSFVAGQLLIGRVLAQTTASSLSTCPTSTPTYPAPVVASGWKAQLIATGLTTPRSILFDSSGHLLVVQAGSGVVSLEFNDNGGTCISVSQTTHLINSTDLNHGIALSNDGKTLYASSFEAVFYWSFDASTQTVGGSNNTLIDNMSNTDHTTRTLLMSQMQPGILLVSRGSATNVDTIAVDIKSGHSQIRAFNVSNMTTTSPPYDFPTTGRLLGWGLRNSVGLAEEPLTGGIYSVENSVDQIMREGIDIHQDNPGEEMNFHGYLNSSTEHQGGNYGYPDCFALWDTDIPDNGTLVTGDQFTTNPSSTLNDTTCATTRVAPRLTFQAHMAPLDIIFLPNATEAYVTFHGSWDRTNPVGYKLSSIAFADGAPIAPSDSKTSLTDIFTNADNSKCPDSCFRPVGLALDAKGRLFLSSDTTGEIWVLVKTGDAAAVAPSSSSGTTASAAISSTPSATQTPNGAVASRTLNIHSLFLAALGVLAASWMVVSS